MKLRTRLALAFLFLSVVPLTVITLYSYNSSIRAFRRAMEAEETTIASEMGRRMEYVTAAVSDRVNRVSNAAQSRDWRTRNRDQDEQFRRQVATELGDAAGFVSQLKFVPAPPFPPGPPPPPPDGRRMRYSMPGERPMPPGPRRGRPGDFGAGPAPAAPTPPAQPSPARSEPPAASPVAQPQPDSRQAAAEAKKKASAQIRASVQARKASAQIREKVAEIQQKSAELQAAIDLMPEGTVVPRDLQRLAELKELGSVRDLAASIPQLANAGVAAGAQAVGAAMEAASKMAEQRARDIQRIEAGSRRAEQRYQAWMQQMRRGEGIDIQLHRDGNLVGTVNAKIDLDRVLSAVLSGRARQAGEIVFAIDADGKLHTPDPRDRQKLESLGLLDRVRKSKDRQLAVSNDDWVMVTRRDQTGVLFGIARPIGSALADIRRTTGRNAGLGLLAIVVALVGIAPISRRMTRNISVLHSGVTQIAQGDLSVRVPVRSSDEIGHLAQAFNQMAQDLGAHQKLLAERERLRGELELCRQIQHEMLPKHPLRLGFAEVKGVSIPAREVGGDFFNYFLLPEGEVAVLVGDVSGKGVGAALLMANVQATLRARLPVEPDLARLADTIDREMEENTPQSVYLTLFVGILDSSHRRLRYVNAGHNPQFVLRANGGLDRLASTGLPVGMFAGHGYQEASLDLNLGDVLFFYTDGMTEVENEAGEMFGSERLEGLLVNHHTEGVDAILTRIEQEVTEFRGHAEPFDDATMMVLRVGAEPSAPPASDCKSTD